MLEVVWYKKDLRVQDHAVLCAAVEEARAGGAEVLCLFVYEPGLMAERDFSWRHFLFQRECLEELDGDLRELGARLVTAVGDVVRVMEALRKKYGQVRIWSHEETGNAWTYRRDVELSKWLTEKGVTWLETPQTGVTRRLRERDGWAKKWATRMGKPVLEVPEPWPVADEEGLGILGPERFGLEADGANEGEDLNLHRQRGGRSRGLELIDSFLSARGVNYTREMSSPVTGYEACSRISPYLTYGCLSMKEAYQIGMGRKGDLAALKAAGQKYDARWNSALKSFLGRLRWHCHFMQKLEDEPTIEWENFARIYDGLRDEWNDEYFAAWRDGRTGYPMIDACMRALRATGYLNFRMRAMVMSFASYHLWLHWRETGLHLAQMFTDYEPGIHWSQVQMQSGTTAINTVRVYSPRKQVEDQDPEGKFIRKWVPELKDVPDSHLAEPHTLPEMEQVFCGCVIGRDYPAPIVEHKKAYARAQAEIRGVRKTSEGRMQANAIQKKHGSRRKSSREWR